MTLLVTVFAAIAATIIWYLKDPGNQLKTGTLCLMYWGASLMWLVDAVVEYLDLGAAYFLPEVKDMLNDFFLGLSVIALGLIIWLILLLFKDPGGVLARLLHK